MKKTSYLLLIAVAFGVFTCDKEHDTVINGVVTDAKTGLPIAGVVIDYGLYEPGNTGGVFSIKSDDQGEFQIVFDKNHGVSGFSARKVGYQERLSLWGEGVVYTKGTTNDINLILHPLDGVLKLVLQNEDLSTHLLFVQFQTNTLRAVYGQLPFVIPHPYPVELSSNSTTEQYYPVTSEEMAYFYWDNINFDSKNPGIAAFSDSLYLINGDTSVFEIHL